ncbi:MAG: PTS sugar transporter subunit IIB [Endomicrobium sp.]|uniref:PTS system mannose/fructose/N-acetylgalactosamine-transporter subunit IIB n=1 Tax=Candidatus Endomicrobiellum pyrsonymphae TaxID=1408203 RepID=UPI0035804117|nr:PTS sugar transporter subunit IIB [Endomicrobium sp.]
MPIVLARIDDRLVHGQIVQGWLKTISIDTLLVVSDLASCDKMQQALMAMALPSVVEFTVQSIKDATNTILSRQYDNRKVMLLTISPSDILHMIENGVNLKSLNVGGMHFVNGKKQLLYNIYVDDKDIENLYKICIKGVDIEGRILPGDERLNIVPLIEKEYLAMCEAQK